MNVQWKMPDGNGGWYLAHHETDAELVKYSNTTVKDYLDNLPIAGLSTGVSSYMAQLLTAQDEFAAREILRVGRETFYDETGHRWTIGAGAPCITDDTPKFGTGSLYLNGVSYLTRPITLGGKNFTIAGWFYSDTPSTAQQGLFSWGNSTNHIYIGRNSSNKFFWLAAGVDSFATNSNTTEEFTTGKWNHVALSYNHSNNTLYLCFNGKLLWSQSSTWFQTESTYSFYLGMSIRNTDYKFNGKVDDFLITEGCLYSADYTLPVDSYTFIANKRLALLHFDE